MKVYVDKKELDNSILDTISDKQGTYVLVSNDKNNPKKDSLVFCNLSDYTKQVRKEVVKEIKHKLVQMGRWDIQENGSIYFKMNINTLNDILDKFEQEE